MVVKFWLRGVFVFFREIKNNVLLPNVIAGKEKHMSFHGLDRYNFPITSEKSYDTISWYLNYKQDHRVTAILHNTPEVRNYTYEGVKILFAKGEIPNIRRKYLLIKFIIIGIHCIAHSLIKLLIGQWQYAFMLSEMIKSLKMQYINKIDLSMVYIFNNSDWAYRPLWSYVAESRGSEVQLYFYSTNILNSSMKIKI
jgi:polysaccharide biosynthesis PFTS motif protein